MGPMLEKPKPGPRVFPPGGESRRAGLMASGQRAASKLTLCLEAL